MKEYDSVVLSKDYMGLKKGTKGTIVLQYDEHNFEVEFFDNDYNTIDVYTISDEYLFLDYQ